MKENARKSGLISLIPSAVFLFLGIILIKHPEDTIRYVSYILGALLIAFGVIRLNTYFSLREKFQYYDFNLMLGSLCFLIGLVIITFGKTIASIFGIVIGIWIVLSSVNRIHLSLKLKDSGLKYWYISLIVAILVLMVGLYVIFTPELILVTLGILLLIYSAIDILQSLIFIVNTEKMFNE